MTEVAWRGPRISLASMERIKRIIAEAPERIPSKMGEYFAAIVHERQNLINYIPDDEVPELLYIKLIEDYYITNKGRLDRRFKELLAVLMGEVNRCRRCVTIHSASARSAGVEDEQIKIVRNFDERKDELPEKMRKALEFAVKVSTAHLAVVEDDVGGLRGLG